jgi:hypothetical protein
MKKKIFISTLNGQWSGVFNAPDGSQYPLNYTFKVEGASLTGTLDVAGTSVPIDSGKVTGDNVSFSITVQGTLYKHTGKYFAGADTLGLDVAFEGTKAHTLLKRAK